MGIRTIGFEKVVRTSTREEKPPTPSDVTSPKEKTSVKEENDVSEKKESCGKASTLNEGEVLKPATPIPVAVAETSGGTGSPVKLRTPASMARLGGIKAAARKLKKQRKRRLFVRATATNKILRNSIKAKATKTRRSFRVEENSREKTVTAPLRVSTRMCVRRSSREGIIPESPLRTVELIKRPLELREPATKILYLASLGLYPDPGDSDMTPITVFKELAGSPGKKNGVRKSLELPLMPIHRRILDGANPEKRCSFENIKPATKQSKRESQKTSPVPKTEKQDLQKSEIKQIGKQVSEMKRVSESKQAPEIKRTPEIKQAPEIKRTSELKQALEIKRTSEIKQAPEIKKSPPFTSSLSTVAEAISFVANNYTKANLESLKKKSPGNGIAKSMDKSLDLTIATGKLGTVATPIVHGAGKANSNSKSLLKTNLSAPTMADIHFPSALDLIQTISAAQNGIGKPSSKPTNTYDVTNAMNLIMSSITILPAPVKPSRKRRANTNATHPAINAKLMEAQMSSTINGIPPILFNEKPPRKKQKNNEVKSCSFSLPVSTVNVSKTSPSQFQNNSFAQPPPMPIQNPEEALNLCVKRSTEPPVALVKTPPKLQNKSTIKNEIKGSINGPKPLNLIIPRPPPLTKAPLDLAKIANPISFSQNVQPVQKPKSTTKKPRKPRVNGNNNQRNQSAMQLSLLPQLTSQLAASAESTAHAKSLLKCMNGEENSCAREVGETLDSVKTMLARLQTSIGPAVNGVRLITIE